jgi:hypothetical protein
MEHESLEKQAAAGTLLRQPDRETSIPASRAASVSVSASAGQLHTGPSPTIAHQAAKQNGVVSGEAVTSSSDEAKTSRGGSRLVPKAYSICGRRS